MANAHLSLRIVAPIGRLLAASLFVGSAMQGILNPSGMLAEMAARSMPLPYLFMPATIVLELVGATGLILGYKTGLAAATLGIFALVATCIFHSHFEIQSELHMFAKDVALSGALLCIAVVGSGPFSLDNLRARHLDSDVEKPDR